MAKKKPKANKKKTGLGNLNEKQERFAQEFIIDRCAAKAAIRAGYSEKTARSIGSRLLTKVDIIARIDILRAEVEKKTEITQERVLKEYGRLAFFDIRKLYDENGNLIHITELDDDTAGAVTGIEIAREGFGKKTEDEAPTYIHKYKFADKTKALDSIARHLGMFEKDNEQSRGDVIIEQKVYGFAEKPKDTTPE